MGWNSCTKVVEKTFFDTFSVDNIHSTIDFIKIRTNEAIQQKLLNGALYN